MAVINSKTLDNARLIVNHLKAIYSPNKRYGGAVARKATLRYYYNLSESNVDTALKYLISANIVEHGYKSGNELTYRFVTLKEHTDRGGSVSQYDNLRIDGRAYSFRGLAPPQMDDSDPYTATLRHGQQDDLWWHKDKIWVLDGSGMAEQIDGESLWHEQDRDSQPEPEHTPEPDSDPSTGSDAIEYMDRVAEAALMGDWAQLQHFIEREAALGGTANT